MSVCVYCREPEQLHTRPTGYCRFGDTRFSLELPDPVVVTAERIIAGEDFDDEDAIMVARAFLALERAA